MLTAFPPRDEIEANRRQVCDALRHHQSFLICGHIRPDGDCLGSQIALGLGLKTLGKEVRIHSPGPILRHLRFVPELALIETALDLSFEPEVTILCDCSSPDRVAKDFEPRGLVINIDHHVSNRDFGDVN